MAATTMDTALVAGQGVRYFISSDPYEQDAYIEWTPDADGEALHAASRVAKAHGYVFWDLNDLRYEPERYKEDGVSWHREILYPARLMDDPPTE